MSGLGWLIQLVVAGLVLLGASVLGIAGVAATGRWLTECNGIPWSELHYTSDCRDAVSIMVAGGVVAIITGFVILWVFRRRR